MRNLVMLSLAFGTLVLSNSCQKDKEPFEYPDNEITEPSTVTQMTRIIDEGENWTMLNSAEGCDLSFGANTFAQNELNYSRNFAMMFLVPDTNACSPIVSFQSPFQNSEVPSDYWDNWRFEFAFSELQLNQATELRLEFDYREVQLNLDLAPIMREQLVPDSAVHDTDGVLVLEFQQGFTNFYLNGYNWKPDFSDGSNNSFVKDATVTDPRIKVTLSSVGTEERSLLIFNFIRVTSYGIPE